MSTTQPDNVLLLINHDVSRDWFGCYGAPIHTPGIDGLADSGFTFDRHYCQYPLCGPSRASLFTGCRPDTTGIYSNIEFYPEFRRRVGAGSATLPEHFQSRGYRTQAVNNVGLVELLAAVEAHHKFLAESGELQRRRSFRRREELLSRVEYEVRRRLSAKAQTDPRIAGLFREVEEGRLDAHAASVSVLEGTLLGN